MAKQTLEQWIRDALVHTPEPNEKCTSLVLMHIVGQSEREIFTIKIAAGKWTEQELAKTFRGKAEGYAAELPGVQTFCLLAFYQNRSEPQARKPLTISGESDYGAQLTTEGPTQGGLAQQAMRHMEAVYALSLRQQATVFDNMSRMMETMSRTTAQLATENREGFDIIKQLLLERELGRSAHRLEELAHIRGTHERDRLLALAPALLNTITGREIVPQSTADSSLLETLFKDLTEEDFHKLMATGVIKPQVAGMLAGRVTEILRKKRGLEDEIQKVMAEEQAAMASGNGNGQDHTPPELDS